MPCGISTYDIILYTNNTIIRVLKGEFIIILTLCPVQYTTTSVGRFK